MPSPEGSPPLVPGTRACVALHGDRNCDYAYAIRAAFDGEVNHPALFRRAQRNHKGPEMGGTYPGTAS